MNVFEREFTLCRRSYFNWECERGFKNLEELNVALKDPNYKKAQTTFFPGYRVTPSFMREFYIQYLLIPRIGIDKRKDLIIQNQ
jgi:hypothetical protein